MSATLFRSAIKGAIVLLLTTAPAHAYIDPGAGSLILQGLIGAVAGGLFLMRAWWAKIAAFLPGGRKAPDKPTDANPQ